MGRCNGGGGRRHGGGGFQEGQKSGAKAGKAGHGKSGKHDGAKSQREPQRLDKLGRPLNHGPWVNGYHVKTKDPKPGPDEVHMQTEQLGAPGSAYWLGGQSSHAEATWFGALPLGHVDLTPPWHMCPDGHCASPTRTCSLPASSGVVKCPVETLVGASEPLGQNVAAPPQGSCSLDVEPRGQ